MILSYSQAHSILVAGFTVLANFSITLVCDAVPKFHMQFTGSSCILYWDQYTLALTLEN